MQQSVIEPVERRLLLATFPVTLTDDAGPGSLRDAITAANATPGLDTIEFNIGAGGPQSIILLTFLPIVTDPLIIDGTTQPGYTDRPLITLDGVNLTSSTGLRISAGNSTVRGLRVTRFGNNGLALDTAGGNVVEGNWLVDNGADGVQINASNNRVGGPNVAQRNVVSSNGDSGIDISGGSGNVVQGNFIGVEFTGAVISANSNYGVRIADGSNNLIGGTGAGERNIISGNASDGVRITGFSSGNFVRGNWIGLNVNGEARGNAENGVTVFSPNNTVGGDMAGAGNVISGNADYGIEISGASASGIVVQGNFIGTDAAGAAALGNGPAFGSVAGVRINGTSNVTIGGPTVLARNVISGNNGDGVRIEGLGATSNVVQGNFLGTNASGNAAVPNTNDGIQIRSGANTVGGTQNGEGNLISGNSDDGIDIRNAAADGNLVRGNRIGTDVSGTVALANGSDGIEIHGAVNTTIGGTSPAARNVISGNFSDGIEIIADALGPATGIEILGNSIGVDATGLPLGNLGHGVQIKAGGTTAVGTAATGAGNVIAHNGLDGVFVNSTSGHSIRGNSIFSNGGLGIDLGFDGVTANDTGDVDIGANELQNYPTINSATAGPGGTVVHLTVNSTPNRSLVIDLYSNPSADPSGFGEGATYLGSMTVNTDASGTGVGGINVGAIPAGAFITATATTAGGSTSEFCQAVVVQPDTVAPVAAYSQFIYDGFTLPSAPHRLVYGFNKNVSQSLDPADLVLMRNGSPFNTTVAVSYDLSTNTATFTFPGVASGVLPDGQYEATLLSGGVFDQNNTHLPADVLDEFFVLAGDANRDRLVNLQDFNILAANFGQSDRTFSRGDFNYDGIVNLSDFNILAARFGTAAIVPQRAPAGETGFAGTALDQSDGSGFDSAKADETDGNGEGEPPGQRIELVI